MNWRSCLRELCCWCIHYTHDNRTSHTTTSMTFIDCRLAPAVKFPRVFENFSGSSSAHDTRRHDSRFESIQFSLTVTSFVVLCASFQQWCDRWLGPGTCENHKENYDDLAGCQEKCRSASAAVCDINDGLTWLQCCPTREPKIQSFKKLFLSSQLLARLVSWEITKVECSLCESDFCCCCVFLFCLERFRRNSLF